MPSGQRYLKEKSGRKHKFVTSQPTRPSKIKERVMRAKKRVERIKTHPPPWRDRENPIFPIHRSPLFNYVAFTFLCVVFILWGPPILRIPVFIVSGTILAVKIWQRMSK